MKPKPRHFLIFWSGYQLKTGKSISGELVHVGMNFPSRKGLFNKVEKKIEKEGFIINGMMELTREDMEHWLGVHDELQNIQQNGVSSSINYSPTNPEMEGDQS
jgi:hypothetical protein